MRGLAGVLAVLDLLLALGVFSLIARPEVFLGLLATLAGEGAAWDEGRLDEAGRQRLLLLADRAAVPGLLLLFCNSFLVGALLLASRF